MSSGHGSGTIVLGSILAAAGLMPVLRSLEIITAGRVNAPLWVVGWIGGLFVIGGLLAVVLGIAGMQRAKRAALRKLESPNRPEVWDREWNPDAITDGSLRRSVQQLIAAGFFAAFLVPFVWWAFLSGKGALMVKVITGFFLAIAVLVVGTALLRVARTLRFGESRLRLPQFPLRPGQRAELRLEVSGDLSQVDRVVGELRFVEEVWEISERCKSNERTQQRVRFALWRQDLDIATPDLLEAESGSFVIPIELPDEHSELVTTISSEPCRYWELDIRVERPGLDYVGAFPLPVYGEASVVAPAFATQS